MMLAAARCVLCYTTFFSMAFHYMNLESFCTVWQLSAGEVMKRTVQRIVAPFLHAGPQTLSQGFSPLRRRRVGKDSGIG